MLVWANSQLWKVKGLPGSSRKWPGATELKALSYRDMPTRRALAELEDDDEADPKPGVTLLDANEYSPSATNGFHFLTVHPDWVGVYELTAGGEQLAKAFADHLQATECPRKKWFADPFANELKAGELAKFSELLRLDAPTPGEQAAFAAHYFPTVFTQEKDSLPVPEDFFLRAQGMTLALRAMLAEERAAGTQGALIHVNQIRHTMARSAGSDGQPFELTDVQAVHRRWQSLQIRQYLKLALETLLRACEARIHQAIVKSFRFTETGERLHVSRSIEDIASDIGVMVRENLSEETPAPHTVGSLLQRIEAARGDAASLYLAGVNNARVDIQSTMWELRQDSKFKVADDKQGRATARACFALLWCAAEAAHLPEESLYEHADMLPLSTLRELTETNAEARIEDFVAMMVRDYVVNLHFDVVRSRAEDDVNAGKTPKDRYRILLGDAGLERNLAGNQALSNAPVLEDTLHHVLYLLAQLGLIKQSEKNKYEFRLLAPGRRRAAETVPPSPLQAAQ
jgi:hypothetical protein